MKKLITLLLIISLILPAAALAGTYVTGVYTLFIDSYEYRGRVTTNWSFDSMVFELITTSDSRTAYYSQQKWIDGVRRSTDYVECKVTTDGDTFILSFPDGTTMDGYYDPDGDGIWVNLGQKTYFRFVPARRYDAVKDYNKMED